MKRMRSRRAKILRWAAITVAVVLVAGAAGAYAVFRSELGGITHIQKLDSYRRPPQYNNALNILLLGSDTRAGHNAAVGGRIGCSCSDTIMLAHISPGAGKVIVVSIPRDTMVPYDKCAPWNGLPGQQADPYAVERINATLEAGGPECVRSTVEQQTGIYIDNVIELDFTGFEKVINDLGGVNVCLPFAIHNVVTAAGGSGLNLSAGEHHIDGRVALQFWRTRENVADGSDTARIARDQYLLAQIVKGVLHSRVLRSPTKLYQVIGDVARSMTTDASDTGLLHIATSLNGISTKDVQFITAPWAAYPGNPNEVEFAQPQADAVFFAIAHDTALPKQPRKKAKNGASPAGQLLTISPTLVKVLILNGSDGVNLTSQASAALTSRGFTVVGSGYASTTGYRRSVIEYSTAADLAAANTLKEQFSAAALRRVPGLTPGTVEVILGSAFRALAPARPTSPSSISGLAASYGGITAQVSCRNSAFYGYYDSTTPGPASCSC
jgi:LCP family protein required for cell wall assembly